MRQSDSLTVSQPTVRQSDQSPHVVLCMLCYTKQYTNQAVRVAPRRPRPTDQAVRVASAPL